MESTEDFTQYLRVREFRLDVYFTQVYKVRFQHWGVPHISFSLPCS